MFFLQYTSLPEDLVDPVGSRPNIRDDDGEVYGKDIEADNDDDDIDDDHDRDDEEEEKFVGSIQ